MHKLSIWRENLQIFHSFAPYIFLVVSIPVVFLALQMSPQTSLQPQPTTIPPHYSPALTEESNQFLQKIGVINHTSTHFSLKEGIVYFGSTPLTSLTTREHSILTELINRTPKPLSIDEIADLIFPKEEKFSLTAIGKTIERLRKKLSELGISSSYLATASGVGYYLKN